MIVIKDRLGQEHKCLILNDVISVTTGLKETISCSLPESNVTDYSKASKEKKKLYQTILTVDKQKQVIESVVKQSEESIELLMILKFHLMVLKVKSKKSQMLFINLKRVIIIYLRIVINFFIKI